MLLWLSAPTPSLGWQTPLPALSESLLIAVSCTCRLHPPAGTITFCFGRLKHNWCTSRALERRVRGKLYALYGHAHERVLSSSRFSRPASKPASRGGESAAGSCTMTGGGGGRAPAAGGGSQNGTAGRLRRAAGACISTAWLGRSAASTAASAS